MILTLPCATCGWDDDCPHNIKHCVINNGYKNKYQGGEKKDETSATVSNANDK